MGMYPRILQCALELQIWGGRARIRRGICPLIKDIPLIAEFAAAIYP